MARIPVQEVARPYPASRPFPDDYELTPKEVLNLLVDLNGRYAGRFNRAIDEMHLAIDVIWQDAEDAK